MRKDWLGFWALISLQLALRFTPHPIAETALQALYGGSYVYLAGWLTHLWGRDVP